MGWAGGSEVMQGIAEALEDDQERADFFERVIDVLDAHDWDTHAEVAGIDDDLDEALRRKGYLDEEEEGDSVDELNAKVEALEKERDELKKKLELREQQRERADDERCSALERERHIQKQLIDLREEAADLRQSLGFAANYPLTKEQCRDLVTHAVKQKQRVATIADRLRIPHAGKTVEDLSKLIDAELVKLMSAAAVNSKMPDPFK